MPLTFADSKNWGFISNQLTASLIDGSGNILWLCFPRFESDPVIGFLLDEKNGGTFSIRPKDAYKSEQKYIAPNILRTTFSTEKGACSITDFLLPGKTMLVREIKSEVDLELELKPTFNFNNSPVNYSEKDGFLVFDNANSSERLAAKISMDIKDRSADGKYTLGPGYGHVILAYYASQDVFDFPAEREIFQTIPKSLESTVEYWSSKAKIETDGLKMSGDAKLDQIFKVSIGVILGLMYSPTGGIIAAPTTSLPEDPGGVRNWDYRYLWVRDCSMMASSLCDTGSIVEGRRALEFIFGLVDFSGKPLYNLYKVTGSRIYGERYITNLAGFMNSKPVKAGNRASNQMQLDIEGEFLDAVNHYFKKSNDSVFVESHLKAIEYIGDWIAENWQLTDSSIWEKPTDREYTYSKVMMWVALDRAGKLLSVVNKPDRWKNTRENIKKWVMSNCVKDGHFVVESESTKTDATPLLFPVYGFIDVNDGIFTETLKVIEKNLARDGFVFRYLSDSLGKSTHPFTLCSFWLSSVYSMLGDRKKAKEILDSVAYVSGPLGLIGEDIDVKEKVFTGNFPQGFSHAGFIRAFMKMTGNQ